MAQRVLVVYMSGEAKPLLRLDVLDADMVHPGWMRFRLEATVPGWETPTTCWYPVPPGASVELQTKLTDADVLAQLGREGVA